MLRECNIAQKPSSYIRVSGVILRIARNPYSIRFSAVIALNATVEQRHLRASSIGAGSGQSGSQLCVCSIRVAVPPSGWLS
jgi:hypothetical protein